MFDRDRGTGRTTGMILAAGALAAQGKRVVLVFRTKRDADIHMADAPRVLQSIAPKGYISQAPRAFWAKGKGDGVIFFRHFEEPSRMYGLKYDVWTYDHALSIVPYSKQTADLSAEWAAFPGFTPWDALVRGVGVMQAMEAKNAPTPAPVLPALDPSDQAVVKVRPVVNGYVITPLTKQGASAYAHQSDELVATDLADLEFKLQHLMRAQLQSILLHFQPKPVTAEDVGL